MANRTATPVFQTDTAKTPTTAISLAASTSTTVAAANADRVEVTITNDHATAIVYLALGATAVLSQGIRLNAAGGSYTTSAYTGAITAISSTASTGVLVTEV